MIRATPQVSHITSIAGDYAAVMVNDPVTNIDLWVLRMHPRYEMQPFKRTPAVERQGSLSGEPMDSLRFERIWPLGNLCRACSWARRKKANFH